MNRRWLTNLSCYVTCACLEVKLHNQNALEPRCEHIVQSQKLSFMVYGVSCNGIYFPTWTSWRNTKLCQNLCNRVSSRGLVGRSDAVHASLVVFTLISSFISVAELSSFSMNSMKLFILLHWIRKITLDIGSLARKWFTYILSQQKFIQLIKLI